MCAFGCVEPPLKVMIVANVHFGARVAAALCVTTRARGVAAPAVQQQQQHELRVTVSSISCSASATPLLTADELSHEH